MSFLKFSALTNVTSMLGDDYLIGLGGGKNVKVKIDFLAKLIAPFVPGGQNGFIEVTTNVLPNPVGMPSGYALVGQTTFSQTTGAAITTPGLLNVLAWTSNGVTGTWRIQGSINTGDLIARQELFAFGTVNVYNGSIVMPDMLWNTDTARVDPSTSGRVFSGYIPAQPNKEYTFLKAASGAVFFDANKNPIGYAVATQNGKPAMASLQWVKTLEYTADVIARFVTMPGTAYIGGNGISGHTAAQVAAEMQVLTQGAVGQINKNLIPNDIGTTLLADGTTTGTFVQAIKESQAAILDLFGIQTRTVDSFNPSLVMPQTLFNTDTGRVDPSTTGRVFSGYQVALPNKEYSVLKNAASVFMFDSAKNPIGYADTEVNNKPAMGGLQFVKSIEYATGVINRFVTLPGTAYIGTNGISGRTPEQVAAEMQILTGGAATGEKKIKREYLPDVFGVNMSQVPVNPTVGVTYYPGKRMDLKPRGGLYLEDFFNVATGNMQGLAYGKGKVYVSWDIGGGNTAFRVYDYFDGRLLKTVASLPCGHAGDLDYDPYTGLLYVSTYGSNLLTMNVVNIDAANPSIVRVYDDKRGNISIDPEAKKMFTAYLMPTAPYDLRITVSDMATGANEEPFFIKSLGNIPTQGSVYNNGKLYVLAGMTSLIIYVIDIATKSLDNTIVRGNTGEPEGFALINDALHPFFITGFHNSTLLRKVYSI